MWHWFEVAAQAILIAALTVVSVSPSLAQPAFSARIVDADTGRAVSGVIEYERNPRDWRNLRPTLADGTLSHECPGRVSIRANAAGFRFSEDQLCGGNHTFEVERRSVAHIAQYLPFGDQFSLGEVSIAYVSAMLDETRQEPEAGRSEELSLITLYVARPSRLSIEQRDRIGTAIIRNLSFDFQRLDTNNDWSVSSSELVAAQEPPG